MKRHQAHRHERSLWILSGLIGKPRPRMQVKSQRDRRNGFAPFSVDTISCSGSYYFITVVTDMPLEIKPKFYVDLKRWSREKFLRMAGNQIARVTATGRVHATNTPPRTISDRWWRPARRVSKAGGETAAVYARRICVAYRDIEVQAPPVPQEPRVRQWRSEPTSQHATSWAKGKRKTHRSAR